MSDPGAATDRWVGLSARLQRVVAARSRRRDLVLRIAPDLGDDPRGWSGWYRPDLAEVRLPAGAVLAAGAEPSRVDVTTAAGRRADPRLVGALSLAGAHAAHTRWAPPAGPDPALDLLERLRVVRIQLDETPTDRPWLRAAAGLIATGPWPLVALLGLGRAGLLDGAETAPARAHLQERLGPGVVADVESVVAVAVAADDDAIDLLRAQAEALATLLGAPDATDSPDSTDELRRVLERVTQPSDEPGRHPSRPREEDLRLAERELAQAAAADVFSAVADGARDVRRDPDPQLRQAARALAGALRRARYRAAEVTLAPSLVPPGRLRLAEAMRREAQRAAGAEVTARPWLRPRRRAVDQPPLRVGLSWDVSRSRSRLHPRMAELAWALSWAMRHVGGELAAVAWNSRVSAVQWPGRVPAQVVEPPCGGRSSACPQSLRALAGALDLDEPGGVRVVIVATDGQVPNRRAIGAEADRLARDGVSVLWVTSEVDPRPPAGVVPVVLADPDTLVPTLGDAVCRLLGHG